jgi:hypothetical protein
MISMIDDQTQSFARLAQHQSCGTAGVTGFQFGIGRSNRGNTAGEFHGRRTLCPRERSVVGYVHIPFDPLVLIELVFIDVKTIRGLREARLFSHSFDG